MELKRYWFLLKRWSWLILLFMVLAGSGTYGISTLMTPVYQASTTLLINQAPSSSTSPDYNSLLTSERLAKTYKELLRKQPVLDKVIDNLQLHISNEQLDKQVTVDLVRDTQLLVLSVEDTSPTRAAQIANEITRVFNSQNQQVQEGRYASTKQSLQEELDKIQADITKTQAALDAVKGATSTEQVAEQNRLQTALTQYRNSYATLLKSFEDVRLAEAQASSNLTVVEEARIAKKIRPNTTTNTILAVVVGFLLALSLAFLIEYLDDSVKSTEQIELLTGVSTIGIISRIKGGSHPERLVTMTQVSSSNAEAYRVLRANIEFSEVDKPIRTLVVTSTNAGEGKTTTTANLAVAIAQAGKRVIVVDCDLRRPSLHQYFQLSNARGVTTVLLDQGGSAADHLLPTALENLFIMPSGPLPPNPAELLGSQRMLDLIEELKTLADVVVFDSSPILPVVDPTLLARLCDATLLVIHAGRTKSGALKKAKNQLMQSGTRMLGAVLNQISTTQRTYYYYYNYSYTSKKPAKRKFPLNLLPGGKPKSGKAKVAHQPTAPVKSAKLEPKVTTPVATLEPEVKPVDQPLSLDEIKLDKPMSSNGNGPAKSNGHHPNGNGNGNGTALLENLEIGSMVEMTRPATTLYGSFALKDGQKIELYSERVIIGRVSRSKGSETPLNSMFSEGAGGGSSKPADNLLVLSVLNDSEVSRRHIGVLQLSGEAYLYDLGSMNGTWLNGMRLDSKPVRLESGDEVRLGTHLTMTYQHNQPTGN